jgi:protein TonB
MTMRRTEVLRWGVSLVVVLATHLCGAAALLTWRAPHDPPASAPVVLLDLEPPVSASPAEQTDAPPGPKQEVSEPTALPVEPETVAETPPVQEPPQPTQVPEPDRLSEALPPPDPQPDAVISTPPPPVRQPIPPPPAAKPTPVAKPVPRRPQTDAKPKATRTTAPAGGPASAARAGEPDPGVAHQPPADIVRRWQSALLAHLQRHKRYPGEARANDAQGVTHLRFAMDRSGRVLMKQVEHASGHRALDQETLDLVERAQPLPSPPSDIPGERFEFVVPVQFQLR